MTTWEMIHRVRSVMNKMERFQSSHTPQMFSTTKNRVSTRIVTKTSIGPASDGGGYGSDHAARYYDG